MRWECFTLDEIFDIKPTANGIDKVKLTPGAGEYPYVTRSDMNNGVNMFVCKQAGCNLNSGNCITVGLDTQTVFYQPSDFYTGQNIQILRHERLNEYTGKFLIPLLNRTLSIYSWGGNGATLTRLRRSKIFLPVDDCGLPDWNFMEDCIRKCKPAMIEAYISRLIASAKVSGILTLDGVKWGKFAIGDLFTVKIGKSIDGNKIDKSAGKTPYITRKESNNGLDGFIDYDECFINSKHPVITIGNETAEPFVQDFPFYTGTKVNILLPRIPTTRQALLFVAQCLKIHKGKYSYAFTINSSRLQKQVIQLPIDDSGNPDWAFMERYMQQEEQRLTGEYTDIIQSKLRNTPPP